MVLKVDRVDGLYKTFNDSLVYVGRQTQDLMVVSSCEHIGKRLCQLVPRNLSTPEAVVVEKVAARRLSVDRIQSVSWAFGSVGESVKESVVVVVSIDSRIKFLIKEGLVDVFVHDHYTRNAMFVLSQEWFAPATMTPLAIVVRLETRPRVGVSTKDSGGA